MEGSFFRRTRVGTLRLGRATPVILASLVGGTCAPTGGLAALPPPPVTDSAEPQMIAESGGRLAWYRGEAHELIAFDAVVDDRRKGTELFLVSPDGSGRKCVTCDVETIPQGFVGQPAWHPDGEHIVIQVENGNSDHRFYNHMAWGIDNDLWLIRRDGSEPRRIWASEDKHGALHPHFSMDGRHLVFAERVPTGKKLGPFLLRRAPGGENHWAGWRIHVADVDLSARDGQVLSNHRTIEPNGEGFYETHGFSPDGQLVYSFTAGGQTYVDDSYSVSIDGSKPKNLTENPKGWEEHAQYSPDGRRLAFISSRVDADLEFPEARPRDLRTEIFLREGDGPVHQLTSMNEREKRQVVVSDFDWDREGRRIAFQAADITGKRHPQIWIMDVP